MSWLSLLIVCSGLCSSILLLHIIVLPTLSTIEIFVALFISSVICITSLIVYLIESIPDYEDNSRY